MCSLFFRPLFILWALLLCVSKVFSEISQEMADACGIIAILDEACRNSTLWEMLVDEDLVVTNLMCSFGLSTTVNGINLRYSAVPSLDNSHYGGTFIAPEEDGDWPLDQYLVDFLLMRGNIISNRSPFDDENTEPDTSEIEFMGYWSEMTDESDYHIAFMATGNFFNMGQLEARKLPGYMKYACIDGEATLVLVPPSIQNGRFQPAEDDQFSVLARNYQDLVILPFFHPYGKSYDQPQKVHVLVNLSTEMVDLEKYSYYQSIFIES